MTLMGWSEWVYLALGLGLGATSSWLWRGKQAPTTDNPSSKSDAQDSYERDLQTLVNQRSQIQLAYYQALEMSQFKAGFLARTSHELRSPLNSLIGSLQLIIANLCESPNEEREFIEQAHDSALKLMGLVDEIVDVSKMEQGTEKINIQSFPLIKIFEDLEQLTVLQAKNRGVHLEISRPDPDIYVLADLPRFRQVLVNLIDHAIGQMDEGIIQVSAQASPESGSVNIWLDDQRPIGAWSESWDLLDHQLEKFKPDNEHFNHNSELSPGMRLLMNQTILELMKGRLEVLAFPSESDDFNFTRTQCSIPLGNNDNGNYTITRKL
jgi:signal transduction histidine kinase